MREEREKREQDLQGLKRWGTSSSKHINKQSNRSESYSSEHFFQKINGQKFSVVDRVWDIQKVNSRAKKRENSSSSSRVVGISVYNPDLTK